VLSERSADKVAEAPTGDAESSGDAAMLAKALLDDDVTRQQQH